VSDETRTGDDELAGAREEISRLKRRLTNERFAEDLIDALTVAAAAGSIVSPVEHSRLLEMIVETAAGVIPSRSAALFVVDEEAEELGLEVALGPEAVQVKDLRVPLGHGIAGLVAVSGQPMAVSDAADDPRRAAEIAENVGYSRGTILCVPLFYDEEVIGVLELLDREGAASYGARDIATLGLFANQAAVAIEQSRAQSSVAALLGDALRSSGVREASPAREERAEDFAAGVEADATHGRALELARLVGEISRRGEQEAAACRTILRGFADYLDSRPEDAAGMAGGFG